MTTPKNSKSQSAQLPQELRPREQLPALLRELLPETADKAIKGAVLYRKLKPHLANCSRRAFSTHIKNLSKDPQSSGVAQRTGGYGFFRSQTGPVNKPVPKLHQQLERLLPELLPSSPDKTVTGSYLCRELKSRLEGSFAEVTTRKAISDLAQDPRSVIARRTGGYGYYRRAEPLTSSQPVSPTRTTEGNSSESRKSASHKPESNISQRDEQREEKFRSLFIRLAELDGKYALKIEHTEAVKRTRGQDIWKFPDAVILEWDRSVRDENPSANGIFGLKRDILEVKRALGEQPFKLTSVELKPKVTFGDLRRDFFQCVSNSSWAHSASLVIASEIQDQVLAAELERLGSSFGVFIETYKLSEDFLENLPLAQTILKMKTDQIEQYAEKVERKSISRGNQKPGLDWSHIGDLKEQHSSFKKLFAWIAKCLVDRKAYPYREWESILA